MAVLEVREVSGGSWTVAAAFGVIGLILLTITTQLFRSLDQTARIGNVLRPSSAA